MDLFLVSVFINLLPRSWSDLQTTGALSCALMLAPQSYLDVAQFSQEQIFLLPSV